jgi:cephalosporin hydroxylase
MWAEKDRGGWRSYAGVIMERKWSDFFTMEILLAHARPRTIVELGTGAGAFAAYLAAYAYIARARFATFDTHRKGMVSKRVNHRSLALVRQLGGRYYDRDVFAPATRAQIGRLVARPGIALIYCDNGDKPRELRTYVDCLKPGDFIGVHDYNSEILPRDLEPLLAAGRCVVWQEAVCERSGSSNRFLRVVA